MPVLCCSMHLLPTLSCIIDAKNSARRCTLFRNSSARVFLAVLQNKLSGRRMLECGAVMALFKKTKSSWLLSAL